MGNREMHIQLTCCVYFVEGKVIASEALVARGVEVASSASQTPMASSHRRGFQPFDQQDACCGRRFGGVASRWLGRGATVSNHWGAYRAGFQGHVGS